MTSSKLPLSMALLLWSLVLGHASSLAQGLSSNDSSPRPVRSVLQLAGPEIAKEASRPTGTVLHPGRDALLQEFEEIDIEHAMRVRRIQDLLDQLKQKARESKNAKNARPAQPVSPVPEPVPEPTPEPETKSLITSSAAPSDSNVVPDSEQPIPQTMTRSVSIPRPMTATVDRLGLANNLFVQGAVDDAGSIYEDLLQVPQEPADLIWIQYQLASCYRMQGRLKDAKKLYRHVASLKEDKYWQSRALWWLEYLARSERILSRQAELQKQIDVLRKEVDEFQTE